MFFSDIVKVTALDGVDGGISLFLHCPGFKANQKSSVADISVDLFISPRELAEGGIEMSEAIALMVQSFSDHVALPHLHLFQLRCKGEGVKAPPLPGRFFFSPRSKITLVALVFIASGPSLKVAGKSYLPPAILSGGAHICAKCRPTGTLSRDIAFMKMDNLPPFTPTAVTSNSTHEDSSTSESEFPVSPSWLKEATLVASSFDPIQPGMPICRYHGHY